jgi:hypothetical protein
MPSCDASPLPRWGRAHSDRSARQLRLDPPPDGQPLEFTTELPLARGRHQLRVAAVTADTSKTGLVITPVEVIEPGRQLMMAPPIVLRRVGAQIAPTAARRFMAGAPLGVQAEVAGRPVADGTVAVRIALVDGTGMIVRTADSATDAGGAPDRQRATGLLDTTGLDSGTYLLTVEAVPTRAADTVRHTIPIRLDAVTPQAQELSAPADYPASGVDTPSLNPSRSVNWNIRTPHGRSAGSLSSAPPAAVIRAAAVSTSARPATLICR